MQDKQNCCQKLGVGPPTLSRVVMSPCVNFPPIPSTEYESSAFPVRWSDGLTPHCSCLPLSGTEEDQIHKGFLKIKILWGPGCFWDERTAPWWLCHRPEKPRFWNVPWCFCPADGSCHLFISDLFRESFHFFFFFLALIFQLITPCVPFSTCSPRCSYLAAIPPCRRLDTLGLPSLSIPPETVSPRVVPSFFISSTTVEPLNSSVKRKAFALLNEKRNPRCHLHGWGSDSSP